MAFVYTGARTAEISFPLGGIGTGCIGLAGNGRLVDWEIANRPNKGSLNGLTHFAVRAEVTSGSGGRVVDARVLQGDLGPPYTGQLSADNYRSFGFGPSRDTLAGAPHFRDAEFRGEFPIAELALGDPHFPGMAVLRAFNPFVPLNARDSGIPAAFFEIELENNTGDDLTYTVVLVCRNPFPVGTTFDSFAREGGASLIRLTSDKHGQDEPEYGNLAIATDAAEVSYQEYLFRGSWFDNLAIYWQDLGAGGRFANRTYATRSRRGRGYSGDDSGLLAAHLPAPRGARVRARFVISWSYPNCANYWNPPKCDCADGKTGCDRADGSTCCCPPTTWKNWYATIFRDSVESALYGLRNWQRLYDETLAFKQALFASTLPPEVLDAVSANISILKSPTVMRLEDGTFYGWEGCHPNAGCCEGTCQHVWNYAYALPFLFPDLERSMRDADFACNQGAAGDMTFRLQLPLGRERATFRPCADGQFGAVIKTYRDWKISGDDAWLRSHWQHVKAALAFAWSAANPDAWDRDRDGVLEGRQHHTLDMELFGPNSWLTGFYLAALKAAGEMGRHLGDGQAVEYEDLYRRGREWVDHNLFNGEYYHQVVDLEDRGMLERYPGSDERVGTAIEGYWDEEHRQVKYQVAEGCIIDQVLAQWHANLIGLGEVLDRGQVRTALRSVYKYNFVEHMRDMFNPCRLFALNDEGGLIICSFPRSKPVVPVPYAEEVMTGFEYQAACHMIQEGLVEEGLRVVRAVRDRYDGARRNPWNEIECGSNYARAMASYSLLLAFAGFEFDRTRGHIGFKPVGAPGRFATFWSLEGAWGQFESEAAGVTLRVIKGALPLRTFHAAALERRAPRSVRLGDDEVESTLADGTLTFAQPIQVEPGRPLTAWYDAPARTGRGGERQR
jgi:non-lysosomal glucosylceramidase